MYCKLGVCSVCMYILFSNPFRNRMSSEITVILQSLWISTLLCDIRLVVVIISACACVCNLYAQYVLLYTSYCRNETITRKRLFKHFFTKENKILPFNPDCFWQYVKQIVTQLGCRFIPIQCMCILDGHHSSNSNLNLN